MARMARPRPAIAPPALPGDVRLVNAVAACIALAALVTLAIAAGVWLTRSPWFAIRSIRLEGEVVRNSTDTIRANAAPVLAGNFFGVDLRRTRAAFEAVPWVRRAIVRRVWPDRLVVRLEEHHAAALWQAEEREDRLVNTYGEVFVANIGDVEDEALPTFGGPAGSAAQMLAMYRRLGSALAPLQLEIEQLMLSTRGSWRALLDNGTTLELGRGDETDVSARLARFVRTISQVTARYRAPLEYADLRHADGYAVRLRGVSTTTAPAGAKPSP